MIPPTHPLPHELLPDGEGDEGDSSVASGGAEGAGGGGDGGTSVTTCFTSVVVLVVLTSVALAPLSCSTYERICASTAAPALPPSAVSTLMPKRALVNPAAFSFVMSAAVYANSNTPGRKFPWFVSYCVLGRFKPL